MEDWMTWIEKERQEDYYQNIKSQIEKAYQTHTIYPEKKLILNAMMRTPIHTIKVVILGQDPYHGPNEAHGLAFSVRAGVKIPPSLRNIFKELQDDLNIPYPNTGDLTPWTQQGVFLLNTTLTVKQHEARSHHHIGWHQFTDRVISHISQVRPYVVFILWGKDAQSKIPLIDKRHGILTSVHPSPLSAHRGFMGSQPFSKANALLKEHDIKPIDWSLEA